MAETQHGENADFTIVSSLSVPAGPICNHASTTRPSLSAACSIKPRRLSEANESLEHVLDHISFMRTVSNKRVVSDDACRTWCATLTATACAMRIFSFPTCWCGV